MPVDIRDEIRRLLEIEKERRNWLQSTQQQVETIFYAARALEPEKRPAFVDDACAGDARLRDRVQTLLDGGTLADRIAARTLTLQEILTVASCLACELDSLHNQGIIHGDLKPEHIVLHPKNRPMELLNCSVSTPTGESNRKVDVRSDIIAFGVVLEEMIGDLDVPDDLHQIAANAANPDSQYRYASAKAIRMDIYRLTIELPNRGKLPWNAFFWLAALAAAIALYAWVSPGS
jgi:hypothetical protein